MAARGKKRSQKNSQKRSGAKRRTSSRKTRQTQHTLSTAKRSKRSQAARERGFHVTAAMRQNPNLSLTKAAELEHIKPGTVTDYFPSAFYKHNGRFRVTKSDRYTVTLYVPDAHGNPVAVKTRSSRERTQLGLYLRDLGRYLRGDANALAAWHGKRVSHVELVTAGRTIEALEPVLSDFSLYRTFNGGCVSSRNPIRDANRRSRRQDRLGTGTSCLFCGYGELEALTRRSRSWLQTTGGVVRIGRLLEQHHIFGVAHDPNAVVTLCLNCHRAITEGLAKEGVSMRPTENPNKLVAAGLRGSAITFEYLAKSYRRLAELLDPYDDQGVSRHPAASTWAELIDSHDEP